MLAWARTVTCGRGDIMNSTFSCVAFFPVFFLCDTGRFVGHFLPAGAWCPDSRFHLGPVTGSGTAPSHSPPFFWYFFLNLWKCQLGLTHRETRFTQPPFLLFFPFQTFATYLRCSCCSNHHNTGLTALLAPLLFLLTGFTFSPNRKQWPELSAC